ncbi:MAG: efflux RND transporter permease subunit [Proteobacteria bacterium]|nr:efflux RND transporter permease subunit [Pseudomonadota bacterium]MCP4919798.1 efflux RND transporter permease subunit [Pseudomonadota bacterium]
MNPLTGDALKRLMKGPIAWMANNPVASNLLMLVLMLGGLVGMGRVTQEVFPSFQLDAVSVQVAYPGASPEDVEQSITRAVEERLRAVDGIKRISSSSGEGVGSVTAELQLDADKQQVLADIGTEVDRIRSFPLDAEEPAIQLVSARREVISLVVSGDQDVRTLQALAEEARSRILATGEVTQVDVFGVPPLEVAVEIDRASLDSYDLTLDEVARQIKAASVEVPGGELDTSSGKVLVRVADRARTADEFADIRIRGSANGAEVRLGDVATVTDGYEDNDYATYFNGKRAVRVTAYRVADETPTSVADAVKGVEAELTEEWPGQVDLTIWNDTSEQLEGRIDLLVRNAQLGLILVFIILALFLDLRLAFWVGLGIPISFLATFFMMPAIGVTVNMVSLFAFIVTLGMVVDDAIIVGENAYSKHQSGLPLDQAAVAGAKEMATPVTFAILTTTAAFAPLFFVPGFIGKIFGIIPAIAVTVLAFSLIESFFILPAHLSHDSPFWNMRIFRPIHRAREIVSGGLEHVIRDRFTPFLRKVIEWRRVSVAAAVGMFVLSIGIVASGAVPFSFFPKLEGEQVTASVRLPYGAPLDQTLGVREQLEASLGETVAEYPEGVVEGVFTTVGQAASVDGPGGGPGAVGSHLMSIQVQLVGSGERDFSSIDFGEAWSTNTEEIAVVDALSFNASSGPGAGAAVDVVVSHEDEDTLAQASAEMAKILRTYETLDQVENTYAAGKPRLDHSLRGEGDQVQLTSQEVGRQIRSAFFGAEALREQRGRHEVKVMVRLPEGERDSIEDLEQFRVRTPGRGLVPLGAVAEFEESKAPTSINREDGRRKVNVKAELAPGVRSNQAVVASLESDVFTQLKEQYPGLELSFAGTQRSQEEVGASLGPNYQLALLAIFALLAIPFRSYKQPLLIMAVIPFGFVGAVLGHLVMGFELSIISMFGIIALTGVVVNDSLVLIDAANQKTAQGASPLESIVYGATRRFRPILLTSLTTFFGLAPMILETDFQARFLIPMAISLGFGVLYATLMVLLIIPALFMLMDDADKRVKWLWKKVKRLFGGRTPVQAEEVTEV